jgi:hypothetical protein
VSPAFVLFQILLSSESFTRASVAIGVGAEERLLGRQMHLVHFTLVPLESAQVGEAWDEFTARLTTLVWPFVSVHMLVPFVSLCESLHFVTAINVITNHLAMLIARWRSVATESPSDLVGGFHWNRGTIVCHNADM